MDGAHALIKTLADLGIEYIFGYSGGAAIPIFDALETWTKTNLFDEMERLPHLRGAQRKSDEPTEPGKRRIGESLMANGWRLREAYR